VIGAIYRGSVAGFQRDEVPRRRFPALDPEPPPPPWWRRLLVPAGVLAAVAVVVTAVRLLLPLVVGSPASRSPEAVRLGHHPVGPAVRAAGRVVLVTGSGSLALANPDGSHLARPGGLGNVGDAVAASPDNRYISLLNGQVISISAGPRLASFPGKVQLSSNTTVTLPDPFADHGRAVVMLQDYGDPTFSSSNPISVISIATGRSVSLGTGDQVAGDPAAAGVFTTVTGPLPTGAVSLQNNPDATVVLRDAGRPPVLLATASELSHDVGLPRHLAVSLAVYPSPSGASAAVTVRPASGGSDGGIVILTRAGRMVAALLVRRGAGPDLSAPFWSPSAKSLAYLSTGRSGAAQLSIWAAGRPIESSDLPASAGRYGSCVWAPDGTSVLCASAGGSEWVVARAAGGQTAVTPGPGLPVAWLR
jgi:hypothetical protein